MHTILYIKDKDKNNFSLYANRHGLVFLSQRNRNTTFEGMDMIKGALLPNHIHFNDIDRIDRGFIKAMKLLELLLRIPDIRLFVSGLPSRLIGDVILIDEDYDYLVISNGQITDPEGKDIAYHRELLRLFRDEDFGDRTMEILKSFTPPQYEVGNSAFTIKWS